MVTIRDIAIEANVSIATVSMALNGKDCISAKTTKKVLEAARKLNYIPSVSAQTLKTRRSRTLGLVVGNLSNTYFSDIVSAAEETERALSYQLFICDSGMRMENAMDCFRTLQAHNVDGILFSLSIHVDDQFAEFVKEIVDHGTKMISLTRCMEVPEVPIVTFTDEEQVYTILSDLVGLGHRRVGAVGGPKGSWMNKSRLGIFRRVMKANGILDESCIAYSALSIEEGKQEALKLLKKHPDLTAVYGINDMVALGILLAAEELGMTVPRDLSIVGCDGIPYVMFSSPKITTVATPRREIGRMAAKRLIDMIEGNEMESTRITLIPCEIVKGESICEPGIRS